jgi:hypothetical protein
MKTFNELSDYIQSAEDKFYSEYFYFSYSSINKLLWNPAAFYQSYVLGQKEEITSPSLLQGKVIHALLLSEQYFNDMYIISKDNFPTGNSKIVIDKLFNHYKELKANGDERTSLNEFENAILDILLDMKYHQSLKTDQQRLDKIITPETENYWNFLTTKENKEVIDTQTYNFCLDATNIIRKNPEISELMGLNLTEFDNKEVHNEIELRKKLDRFSFGLKGILDNIVLDHEHKTIYINDLKTTSKELKDFPESIEYYSYWMQMTVYMILVYFNYNNYISNENYKIKSHFIVIDKNMMTYAFEISNNTQQTWFNRFMNEVMPIVEYHYTEHNYTLPYKFCKQKFIL